MQAEATTNQRQSASPETIERVLLLAALALAAAAVFLQLGLSLHTLTRHIAFELSSALLSL